MSDATVLMAISAALILGAGLIATLRSFVGRKRSGEVRSLNLNE